MSLTRYRKAQILQDTAYVQEQFIDEVQKSIYLNRPLQLSEVVIDESAESFVKSRYLIDEIVETYLIVNSFPTLQRLVALYNKMFNVISKG